eukprot:GABV01007302.1.p1 GENE.GABV01007302.1~~GABV01007302.1.p1  ORF type:complete len:105 (-),score=5.03 GABV01007302.1:3-317(-)
MCFIQTTIPSRSVFLTRCWIWYSAVVTVWETPDGTGDKYNSVYPSKFGYLNAAHQTYSVPPGVGAIFYADGFETERAAGPVMLTSLTQTTDFVQAWRLCETLDA